MSSFYILTLTEEEVEDLLRYYCVARGLQYNYSNYRGSISVKVYDPFYPPAPRPPQPPTQNNYCTKHSLNHGKKHKSCRVTEPATNPPKSVSSRKAK